MFELRKWYEYKVIGSKKRYIGQCIELSRNFVMFHTGFENKPDTVIDNKHLVDITVIRSYKLILPQNIGRKTRKNIETYIKLYDE